jgi:uncharacterized RmlC-like cupin family protein
MATLSSVYDGCEIEYSGFLFLERGAIMKHTRVVLTLSMVFTASSAFSTGQPDAASSMPTEANEQRVMVIKTPPEILTRQRLPNFVGISGKSVGAKGLSMNLVVIPPGAKAEPHFHKGYESAVYVLKGRVETRYGTGLKQSVITEAGDFLFIPPDVPHQPINLSETEAAQAIVVRNDPAEQEHVILYDPQ